MRCRLLFFGWILVVGGCGSDAAPSNPDAREGDLGGTDAAIGGDGDTWQRLIESAWEVEPGKEIYRCERLTVTEDLYITDFRAVAPEGTHHTVLTVGEPSGPDGSSACGAGTNADAMIYGSGVGTDPISFPPGVAMRVEAGQQLLINLHLFNVTGEPITGVSGTDVKTVPADQVEHVAEVLLMGKANGLTVPPGESTQVGTCTMNGDVTLFAVGPHMHQLGTHMKVVANGGEGAAVLHDAPYDFYEQRVHPLDSQLPLAAGDTVDVHCTYNNTTGNVVTFGDSSTEEMCFAGVYRYPALGSSLGIVCIF